MNKIEAIKSIRMARPDVGLESAKDFWDWIDAYDYIPATTLVGLWCEGHWCEQRNCGCAVKLAEANAAGTDALLGEPMTDNRKSALAEKDSMTASGTDSKVLIKCKCGRSDCTDEFHAYLMAMIKKYGEYEAVEMIRAAVFKQLEERQQ